jgi:hypothetical protein
MGRLHFASCGINVHERVGDVRELGSLDVCDFEISGIDVLGNT